MRGCLHINYHYTWSDRRLCDDCGAVFAKRILFSEDRKLIEIWDQLDVEMGPL